MEKLKSLKKRPEDKVREQVITKLRYEGWYVIIMHGNMYQSGVPDLYATHSLYGTRWIEVKLPDMKGSRFTNAQLQNFPKMEANGSRIWVLTGGSQSEYDKLFKESNWTTYLDIFKKHICS